MTGSRRCQVLNVINRSRIRLRQSTLRKGLNLREYFPLGPNRGPEPKGQAVKRFGWNLHSLDIQAANSICDLFRYPYPVKGLRPMVSYP